MKSALNNPAAASLFASVENPFFIRAALTALRAKEKITVEALPVELLEPLFILHCAARELAGAPVLDDNGLIRKRIEEEIATPAALVTALLTGAGFGAHIPTFSEHARMNCEPGEVRLEYLPIGIRFKSCNRVGILIDKTPSRALVEWESVPVSRSFTARGKEVTINSSGSQRTGCALDAAVVPLWSTVTPEERTRVVNAWKELTGVFEEEAPPAAKKGKRK